MLSHQTGVEEEIETGCVQSQRDPAVQFTGVSSGYGKDRPVLEDISLSIPQGQWVTLVGANGCGKSTLVKLINGLLPMTDGQISVEGMALIPATIGDIRKKVGMVFQNPDNQFIGATVEEDIVFGLEGQCLSIEEMEKRLASYAIKLGITELLHKHPSELSGGQKQRVAIASILAMEPEVVILDEASSMLDERTRNELTTIVSEMHQSGQYTILSITHDAEEIAASERVLALHEGKLIADISPAELFQNDELLQKCHLIAPFAVRLRNELHRRGIDLLDLGCDKELWEEIWPLHLMK
ncbi:ATP-binding cassette domain-containing protein [Paenibacillus sp. IHBB 10380]|uniref:ATP-binding cassette domain-containing protein n=1 Tax=Paenibacillus sp. IHBB 10380 TaxID=1566358 RepID=UPI0005CFD334|nr:ATP-binding cassette domain-containing protein [Paenibacillus sp. IHBB 10380]